MKQTIQAGDLAPNGISVSVFVFLSAFVFLSVSVFVQGDPKKTIHSVLQPKSVVVVQFYFFTGVSELEFRARSN